MIKGDRFKVKCIGINNYAKGITKIDSFICFVDNLYEDEEAIIEITDIKKNLCFGKVIEYIKKRSERIDSVCNHNDLSSCPFSNISYDYELEIKKKLIISNINRSLNSNYSDIDIISGDYIDGYRNKVTLFYKEINNEIKIGNFIEGSNEFNLIDSCIQVKDIFLKIAKYLGLLLKKYKIDIVDFINKKGIVKGISIRRSEFNESISVMILSRFNNESFKDIANDLKNEFNDISGISVSINNDFNTFVYSNNEIILYGEPVIVEKFNDIILKASNKSFMQVNTTCASKLYKEASEIIDLNKNDIVVDLYSGCGGIGLTVANKVKVVYSIETVEDAVIQAKENAKLNNINNIEFFRMDALDFDKVIGTKKIKALFVDPPRSGLDKRVIDKILSLDIENIVYISCDSYTMARDLKLLCSKYSLESIKAFNMFPRTKHCESLCILNKY